MLLILVMFGSKGIFVIVGWVILKGEFVFGVFWLVSGSFIVGIDCVEGGIVGVVF